MRFERVWEDGHGSTPFSPLLSVARGAKRAEPLVGRSLERGGRRADDFLSLASGVTGSTERTEARRWRWPISGHRSGALTGRLARPIESEDDALLALPIPPPAWLFLFHQPTGEQTMQTQGY